MFNNHSSHISDYVGVRPHPTVVRLENLSSAEADWLTESFVLTDAVRGHLAALKSLLESGRGGGAFLIGHYGAGKSHFLGYLARELEAGRMLTPAPAVCVVSLVNFSAANRLEDVISDALGLDRQGGDRREVWSALARRYPQGVFLLLDELSEFLRSQSEVSRFNEDIRFLQFLGEWAQNQRFWILAAMQEGIEHTGELEYSLYRKIKDRYPLRLLLSPTHVKTLIADGILIKQPGYEEAVNGLVADWRERMPGVELDYALLPAIYPLHPATLTLLEEVRDRFSQTRGVVDFVVTQLRGDASRGVEPFLQQPWGALISPDVIIDHFRDLFEIQPEYLTLAQQVFPWYEKALPELFPKPVLRQLAERLLKLLALVYLSPARERLTVREAVAWLAFSAARVEPERNLRVVEKTLDTLAERGRYVTADRGGYRLKPRDDAAQALARHLKREMSELVGRDDLVLETLTGLLGEADFNPFRLPRERWLNRQVSWCFHPRAYAVWFGAASPGQQPDAKMAFCLGLPWGPSQPVAGHYTLMPGRIVMREEFTELAALMRLRERPLAPEAAARVDKRIADGKIGFASALQNAWLQARLVGPTGTAETPPRLDARRGLDAWLDAIALLLLKRTYPGFERFAPGYGPLPKEAWRRFMRLSLDDDPMALEADEYARLIREAYLAPMGLLRRRGRDYVVRANLDRHELVAQVMPLAENGVSPKTLYQHLAEPIYGLVEEQVTALLVFLCLQGEIELTKGAHSYRNHFETLPNPIAYDRLSIGQSLDPGQLAALARLCEYFSLKLARDAGAIAQRQAISAVSQRAREQAEALEKFVLPLRQEGLGRRLAEQAQQQIDAWRLLGQGDQGMNALALFLYQVSGVDGFLERDRLLTRQAKRLPGLLAELKRLQHLIHHPMLDAPATETFRSQLKRLEEPPPLEQTDELADWLARAAEHYADYQKDYARRHRDWWNAHLERRTDRWRPPALAASRHLGLEDELAKLEQSREAIARLRCPGLSSLDFQPLCNCGFDGETAPIMAERERFDELKQTIEKRLARYFDQREVRQRMRDWRDQGLELSSGTLAYLQGEQPAPDIVDVATLDKHLAGLDMTVELDTASTLDLLTSRGWEPTELLAALEEHWRPHAGKRLRFNRESESGTPESVALWCVEQALRHGVALPNGLGLDHRQRMIDALRPEWVGAEALRRLDRLALPDEAVDKILGWLYEGTLALPMDIASGPVGALVELRRPSEAADADAAANLASRLYAQHARLLPLAGADWLERLDALAKTPPPQAIPRLIDELPRHEQAQWLLIDCLGPALIEALEPRLRQLFQAWRPPSRGYALVGSETTTDACYAALLEAGLNHPMEKINAIDELIHSGFTPFNDLTKLALTHLELAIKPVLPRLDPARPLLIFADHGFRIRADGSRYEHGGDSLLERLVPVWRFESYTSRDQEYPIQGV